MSVYHFGAVGDGQADDTQALQHALDAGDGVLDLEKGTYRITQPLVINTVVNGYGGISGRSGASRIIMEGAGPAVRVIGNHNGTASPTTYQPTTWENERMPILEGFEILGRHPESVGIELKKTTKTVISRVLVRECKYGIHLIERNRDFILSDSHLLNNSDHGLYFDRCNLHQIIVHGNHISWNGKSGIKSVDGDVHNLQITGNDIEYNNSPGVDQGEGPLGAEIWFDARNGVISEVTIASNTIQATIQPGGANVRIWGNGKADQYSNRLISITGNVLGSQTRGVDLRDGGRIAVTGNTIYDSKDLSLYFERCHGFSVGSNTFVWRSDSNAAKRDGLKFVDCSAGVLTGLQSERLCYGTPERGAGITLENCNDITIGHCQVLDPLHCGIELRECTRCIVDGCTVIDRKNPVTMTEAIRVVGGAENRVERNFV